MTPRPTRRRASPRATGLAGLLLAALAGAAGCSNPFLPAQPAVPGGTDQNVVVSMDFSTPELLLNTMAAAVSVKNKGNGAAAYLAAFADTATQNVGAHIEFDPDVVAERSGAGLSGPPGGWSIAGNEKTFYEYLSTRSAGDFSLTWTDTLTDDTGDPDRQAFNRRYSVTAVSDDFSEVQYVSQGWARIEMRRVSVPTVRWVITRWNDHVLDAQTAPDPSDPGLRCFSRLRIDSYNGVR